MARGLSRQTLRVLQVFVEHGLKPAYGLEVAKSARLASGTIYPILNRLEQEKLVQSDWETIDPSEAGRPRRRLYRLTPNGLARARYEIAAARAELGGGLVTGALRPDGGVA